MSRLSPFLPTFQRNFRVGSAAVNSRFSVRGATRRSIPLSPNSVHSSTTLSRPSGSRASLRMPGNAWSPRWWCSGLGFPRSSNRTSRAPVPSRTSKTGSKLRDSSPPLLRYLQLLQGEAASSRRVSRPRPRAHRVRPRPRAHRVLRRGARRGKTFGADAASTPSAAPASS